MMIIIIIILFILVVKAVDMVDLMVMMGHDSLLPFSCSTVNDVDCGMYGKIIFMKEM